MVIIAAALVAVILVSLGLSSCTTSLSAEESFAVLKSSINEALKNNVYFWEEKIKDEGDSGLNIPKIDEFRSVKVLNNKDSQGNIIASELSAEIILRKGGNDLYLAWCGLSSSGKNKKQVLLEIGAKGRTKIENFPTATFVNEHMNGKGYSLQEVLKEIKGFASGETPPSWAVFKDKSSTEKGKLTELTFNITKNDEYKAYLNKFKEDNGYESCFANAERVSVEVTYGRLSNIICYRQEVVKGTNFKIEINIYELFVFYFGPNIQKFMPSYAETWQNVTEPQIVAFRD
jgi:hypothetical protein